MIRYSSKEEQALCDHCWVWTRKAFNHWLTYKNELFNGDYLVKQCGHCGKQGKILCKWEPGIHDRLIQGSRQGFMSAHDDKPCPSISSQKYKGIEIEEDDF